MKASRVLEICKEIMKYCVEQGFTYQIHKKELERIIKLFRGVDKRTVKTWLQVLLEFDFVEYVNSNVLKLKLEKYPDLLNLAIKNSPQKKLM